MDLGGPTCRSAAPRRLDSPCPEGCGVNETCVDDGQATGGTECRPDLSEDAPDPCAGACVPDAELCVDVDGTPTCRLATPVTTLEGLAEGTGLFTSLVLHGGTPTAVYYDRLHRHLRGAVALFAHDGDPTAGFATGPLVCDAAADVGHHASLAIDPIGDRLAVAYQGSGGETLHYYISDGADLFIGTSELVDDGVRGARLNLVGAHASLAFDAGGDAYIAYADQSDNDLLLATNASGSWQVQTLASEGAHGSFARLAIDGAQAWVTAYLRERDERNADASRLIVTIVDIGAAAASSP